MATYSPNLALTLIVTGDEAGTWGTTTNTNLGKLLEQAISGYVTQAVSTGATTTLTIPNGATGVARNMFLELTGTAGASTVLAVPANKKLYFIYNNATSGAVTVKVTGQTGVSVPYGAKMALVCDGTDVVAAVNYFTAVSAGAIDSTPIGGTTPAAGAFTTGTFSSTLGVTGVATLGNGAILGTPASMTATNITGTASGFTAGTVTTNANLTGGVTSVGNTATVVTNANLTGGVTSVGNAATVVTNANLTGGVTSVGNAATVVTNANLTGGVTSVGNAATVVTNADLTGDVTSVGNATAIAAGVIVNADINASAAIVDTKLATISTASKVSNSATTAASANTASAIVARDARGNFTAGTITAALTGTASGNLVSGGALGTPSSGTVTNLTGTASININGTVGATTATTGSFTTVAASSTVTGAKLIPTGSSATGNGMYLATTDILAFSTAGVERMRIGSAGSVAIGTTGTASALLNVGASASAIPSLQTRRDSTTISPFYIVNAGASGPFAQFEGNGAVNGSITFSGATTAYNTSSDYRLKEQVQPMVGALARVVALKPVTFKWKADGLSGQGFIAHELQEVCPDAVTGAKDAVKVNQEGVESPDHQGVDTSFLVATLVSAIQELKAEFDAYKAAHP